MRLPSLFSLVLLSEAVGRASGNNNNNSCLDQVSANTMAMFSGAPFALAPRYDNGSACAGYCDNLAECHAWLYSVRGGDCQLYKKTALSTFSSQQFMYGVCGSRLPPSSSVAAAAAANSAVVAGVGSPANSGISVSTPAFSAEMSSGSSSSSKSIALSKRHIDNHRHHHHGHRN
ncbi:uncharacterized protein BP01DRAFT_402590 [Aspergillus saccharolyticus JOP 1030-1]|uniref:Apple domain-containing protein n=1 Tax=Aspergillus saccharolyticus JOP 1030-1 TaxID=1450539 RepID=A0A318Z8D3_9EURO|nr:hypothetical protein BP01DRAFT_402590 [Aspergillus saccharolyticus JOP 1030-1]PYH43496.1 hypothetical protein BP01DRAFT_402590 [Aspergillus saccharolyticus JOP 1030-1]